VFSLPTILHTKTYWNGLDDSPFFHPSGTVISLDRVESYIHRSRQSDGRYLPSL
jgi:hypothetical protein